MSTAPRSTPLPTSLAGTALGASTGEPTSHWAPVTSPEEVAPLLSALSSLNADRPCLRFRCLQDNTKDGESRIVEYEFSEYQAADQRWSILSIDGEPPSEAIAKREIRRLEREAKRAHKETPDRWQQLNAEVERAFRDGNLWIQILDPDVVRIRWDTPSVRWLNFSFPATRSQFTLGIDGQLKTYEWAILENWTIRSALKGTAVAERFDLSVTFTRTLPDAPLLVAQRDRVISLRRGEQIILQRESDVFYDHEAVMCYDNRFRVYIGPLEMMKP